jgi:hypothetical protein
MTETGELHYIIGVGSPEDWEASRGSLYYIEDKSGEKALPVFTTQERLVKFVEANFGTPEAYMQMLESLGANAQTHAPALREHRYTVMPVTWEGLTLAAFNMDADYLIRDPRPGGEQEILRVPK